MAQAGVSPSVCYGAEPLGCGVPFRTSFDVKRARSSLQVLIIQLRDSLNGWFKQTGLFRGGQHCLVLQFNSRCIFFFNHFETTFQKVHLDFVSTAVYKSVFLKTYPDFMDFSMILGIDFLDFYKPLNLNIFCLHFVRQNWLLNGQKAWEIQSFVWKRQQKVHVSPKSLWVLLFGCRQSFNVPGCSFLSQRIDRRAAAR
jgi:hypothetical protein